MRKEKRVVAISIGIFILSLSILVANVSVYAIEVTGGGESKFPNLIFPGETLKIYEFWFNNNFTGTNNLQFNFQRDSETRNIEGQLSSANQPRYYSKENFVPSPKILETAIPGSGINKLLGSGRTSDGEGWITILRKSSEGKLIVYVGSDLKEIENGNSSAGEKYTTTLGANMDIFGNTNASKYYKPSAGTVAHGLIVLLTEVHNQNNQPISVAIVTSQDLGQTWQIHYEDDPIQIGGNRVREWAMQNYWPIPREENPFTIYVPFTDYRQKSGNPTGGSVYMFRATRPDANTQWNLEPVAEIYSNNQSVYDHSHSAAVFPYGDEGLRIVSAFGDGQEKNAVVSSTRNDLNYTDLSGWTHDTEYHGSADALNDRDLQGHQFVGAAPGPEINQAIFGSDENSEALVLLEVNDESDSKGSFKNLYNYHYSSGVHVNVFTIRSPNPEKGEDYVTFHRPGSALVGDFYHKIIYSKNGIDWTEVVGENLGTDASAVIVDDYIYVDASDSSVSGKGVRRIPLPQIETSKPLIVQRGADKNWISLIETITIGSGAQLYELSKDTNGNWLDRNNNVIPHPPSMINKLYQIDFARNASSELIARFKLRNSTDFPSGIFNLRAWIFPRSTDDIGEEVAEAHMIRGKLTTTTTQNGQLGGFKLISADNWLPYDLSKSRSGASYNPVFNLQGWSASELGDYRYFFALSSLETGNRISSYPSTIGSENNPDELAKITNFRRVVNWTIELTGKVPNDGWDIQNNYTDKYMLATLYGNSTNYIEIKADLINNKLLAEITRNNVLTDTLEIPNAYWQRGSMLYLKIHSSASQGTILTASIGQSPLVTDTSIKRIALQPNEIRFSNAAQTEVDYFLWYKGKIETSTI